MIDSTPDKKLPTSLSPAWCDRRPAAREASSAQPPVPWFRRSAPIVYAILLAGAAAGVFLAGQPQEGSLGIFLVAAGLVMTVCPPRLPVDWRLWVAVTALVGCAALALLPARWLTQPAWRHTLDHTPEIALPATISTAPSLTVFWLAVLAISLLIGLFLLAHPIRSRWLIVFAVGASLVAAVYGGMAIYAKQTGWHYPYAADATFGFFPNRNHTATLLFVGGLLALGVLSVVLREGRWLAGLLAAGSLAVCVVALAFYSPSRGGIVFLAVGIVGWFIGLGRDHRDTRLAVSFAVLALASVGLFLLSGSEGRKRLLETMHAQHAAARPIDATSPEFRPKIYRDAFDVVGDFPVTGVGLGNFALIFPQYRRASLVDARALHPESDWLMLAAEAGIPATLCAVALVLLAMRRLWRERDHPYWPLRWGCTVAAGAAVLHGWVDVPLHRVQLGWWVLIVAGLALQSSHVRTARHPWLQHACFVVGGVIALSLGTLLIRAQWFGGPSLPPFAAARAESEILATFNRRETEGATDKAREAIEVSPMAEGLYYQYGRLLLQFQDTEAQVDDIFKAQRLLNPVAPTIPLQQGDAWMTITPERTAALWLESLDRQQRIDSTAGHAALNPVDQYRALVRRAHHFPAVQLALGRAAATRSPTYAIAWLDQVDPPIGPEVWTYLTASSKFLESFIALEQQRFLLLWYVKGDRVLLTKFIADHPGWQEAAWPTHLLRLADAQQYKTLVYETIAHYHLNLDLPAIDPGRTQPKLSESDDDVVRNFMQYWSAGNTISARRELEEASLPGRLPLTAEGHKLKASLAVHDADWPTAWAELRQALEMDHPDGNF